MSKFSNQALKKSRYDDLHKDWRTKKFTDTKYFMLDVRGNNCFLPTDS